MKRVRKGLVPPRLSARQSSRPASTWDQISDATKRNIRDQLEADQGGLCAYCESRLSSDWAVEHFVQKSVKIGGLPSWTLDWSNMLGVCLGAEKDPPPRDLHCDRHKNQQVQKMLLCADCRGWVLNPADCPALPSLFIVDLLTGRIQPDLGACSSVTVSDNQYASTEELVRRTIEHLNLNCRKLMDARREVADDLDDAIANCQLTGRLLEDLVQMHFHDPTQWPEFFTVYLTRLGKGGPKWTGAIDYLRNSGYAG